ncbi:unnamed protein product, partial [Prorocentrum cordatum]
VANLGDSGFIHFRRSSWGAMEIAERSREQEHSFNCPYQFCRVPEELARRLVYRDTAANCSEYELALQPGDLLLMYTDGSAIRNDLERTFADLRMVAPRKPQIFRILQQYAVCWGMNYVAATMALKFPDREDLARRRFAEAMLQFSGFWSDGFPLLSFGVHLFSQLAERHLHDLWTHLVCSGVEPLSYLPNGWLSLFGKWLPLPAVMEAMDLVLECGIRGVLAVTLATFQIQQNRLMSANGMEDLLELINQDIRRPRRWHQHQFPMGRVASVKKLATL